MDPLQYLKEAGPNPLSPEIIRTGYIMPGIAYEVSMDWMGLGGKPIWAVTVCRDDIPTNDGGVRTGIDHDLSEPFKSQSACDNYILKLIQDLDPEGFVNPGEKEGPGMP